MDMKWHKWQMMTNVSVLLAKRPLQLVSLSVCDCCHRPILPRIAKRRNFPKISQGNNVKHQRICASWSDLIGSIQFIKSIHHQIHVTSDGLSEIRQQLPLASLWALLVWSPGRDRGKWKQEVSTGFHRSHEKSWKDIMNYTESWDFLIGSWSSVMLCRYGPTSEIKCVCPEQRGMSVPAPSPDLNSHSPFYIRVSAVSAVSAVCPRCTQAA